LRGAETSVTTVAGLHGRRLWTLSPRTQTPERPRTPLRSRPPAERKTPPGLLEVAAPESAPDAGDD
jgi:hypothetical protein